MTNELKKVLSYIKEELLEDFPPNRINADYYIFALLMSKESLGYEALSNILLESTMEELKGYFHNCLQGNVQITLTEPSYDKEMRQCLEETMDILRKNDLIPCEEEVPTNSAHVLAAVLVTNDNIKSIFRRAGVTVDQLSWNKEAPDTNPQLPVPVKSGQKEKPKKHERRKNKPAQDNEPRSVSPFAPIISIEEGIKVVTFLDEQAEKGLIPEVLYREEIYNNIFKVLSKQKKNNVILIGESGVGKTAITHNIANLIRDGKVPPIFRGAKLVLLNMANATMGTARVSLEVRLRSILEMARKKGNCIFLIDDIHITLFGNHKIPEPEAWNVLTMLLDEENIRFIGTTCNRGYANILQPNPTISKKIQKIEIKELSEEESVGVVVRRKASIEDYHDVRFTREAITNAVSLSKRYVADQCLPESAIDILDETGAMMAMEAKENKKIAEYREKIAELNEEKERLKLSSDKKDYDAIDEVTQKIIALESEIKLVEKCEMMDKKPRKAGVAEVKKAVSQKVGAPVNELSADERKRLKGMDVDLKKVVIGQDEAVTEVCKTVKRQRVGLSNPDKPAVLFFGGTTGTGKTYLAKKLAEKVFGSENDLVRLDMSEYNDKISVTKLYGASAGYIGFEQGGVLAEAIKKKKHCVLLLDEMEKADPAVHDVFLQIFDEGHLTDNKGVVVDFRNVIIIMTSNVGATEVAERGGGIGFVHDKADFNKSIIEKALRRKFKPEFLNRIDKIIYFNSLTDDDLKRIISLEIGKVGEKIAKIGYSLDSTLTDCDMVDHVFARVVENKTFGARPIVRVIQDEVDDKVVDAIVEGVVRKGHRFTRKELESGEFVK